MIDALFTGEALGLFTVALGVGVVVGLTGMGGGALMTPALIFLGIPPTAAVANDLVAAAVTKSVGAATHWRHGSPNLRLAGLLMAGSIPFAFAGGFIIRAVGASGDTQAFVKLAIGVALLLTATAFVARMWVGVRNRARGTAVDQVDDPPLRPVPTVLLGMVGGLLVGLTSVGAGSVIMVSLVLLYPTLAPRRLVGTDLVQAVPLVVAAAISHVIVTGVDLEILLPLVIGGAPGTYLGARLASWVPQGLIRRGIAIVLALTGLALVGVPPIWVGICGAALLILGPAFWAMVRVAYGLTPTEKPPETVDDWGSG